MYSVKEIFFTLQGEGVQSGRPAVFCRFSGCNLWTGREVDRSTAVCKFCDTDFFGIGPDGGKFSTATELAARVAELWPSEEAEGGGSKGHGGGKKGHPERSEGSRPGGKQILQRFAPQDDIGSRASSLLPPPYVVCTGGEPLLQLDAPLIDALHAAGFEVAVETNGTQPAPPGIDWMCVSPKANAPLTLTSGDELKLVYPQDESEAQPERFTHLASRHFSLQPMDGPALAENTRRVVEYCLTHPQWRLSLQTHKLLGLR
jgi:organic radical activating enzyme